MLDELRNKAANLANDERVKEVVDKAKEYLNTDKGKEMLDQAKEKVEGFIHKK